MGLRYATDHRRRPRRPARRRRLALRRDGPRRSTSCNPGTGVELLIPDFNGEPELLAEVFGARPEVLAHNVETVPRIFKRIRPGVPLRPLARRASPQARAAGLVTKSNLILGMGETRDEVSQALRDLHDAGCELITITQYLRPSPRHHPVERWVKPEEFVELQRGGRGDRLRRRDERPAGALVVPRRSAVPAGDRRADGTTTVGGTRRARWRYPCTPWRRTGVTKPAKLDARGEEGGPRAEAGSAARRPGQPAVAGVQDDPQGRQATRCRYLIMAFVGAAAVLVVVLMLAISDRCDPDPVSPSSSVSWPRCSSSAAGRSKPLFSQAEGQPGAAGWCCRASSGRLAHHARPSPATTQLDAVHRLIGRPGIVLVGEGLSTRSAA